MARELKLNKVTFIGSGVIVLMLVLGFLTSAIGQTAGPTPGATPATTNITQVPESATRPPDGLTNNPPAPSEATTETNYYLSSKEFIVALLVAFVSLIALSMQFLLLRRITSLRAEDTLRSFGVILILMGTLFVIAAGFDSIQIAPAMGLFGTIAGYLLGRVGKREDEKNEPSN